MAKEHDLGYATHMQSEQSDEPSIEQFEEVDHLGKATALLAYASPDKIFSRRYVNMIDQRQVVSRPRPTMCRSSSTTDGSSRLSRQRCKYDAIKFNELSWSYCYAMCAPVHAAAVHFGSLIEQLQNNSSKVIEVRKSLLKTDAWKALNGVILQWLKTALIDPELRKILEGKVSALNRAPQGLVLKRLLEAMGLAIGDVEVKGCAWRGI